MTMPIDLSLCVLTRDGDHLAKTVASLRPSGAEIVVLYTGYDKAKADAARELADVFDVFTGCNDGDGQIVDFGMARNQCFGLATRGWVGWADDDDLVEGAERLGEVLGCAHGHARPRLLGRYDYAHDPLTGQVTTVQWRERIVRNDGVYHWVHRVHENLVARDGRNEDYRIEQPVRWVHKRATEDRGRNLRILRDYPGAPDDAWYALQLGTELARAGEHAAAVEQLERYVQLSKWDDERATAMLRLSDACAALDPMMVRDDRALWWARKAHELRPSDFEPLWQLAKLYTVQGTLRGDETALRDAIRFAKQAAATPERHTPLAVNPFDRSYRVHDLVRTNAEWLEDWQTALEASDAALASRPDDGQTKLARRRYAAALKLDRAVATPASSELEVLFLCGPTVEPWNPEIAARTGIGGSETAVMEIGKRLAQKGHRVRVYNDCGRPGLYDGVEYTNDLAGVTECEVMVAWRNAEILEGMPARTKIVWAHDVAIHRANRWNLHLADKVVGVSGWHVEELLRRHGESCGLERGKLVAIQNGIDPARFVPCGRCGGRGNDPEHAGACGECGGPRDPHRIIFSSSHERGLLQLLELWPEIRRRVPEATLHVFYGAQALNRFEPEMVERIKSAWRAGEAPLPPGSSIIDHGRVNQAELARHMLAAGVWAHPSWLPDGRPWTETSCIGAMEAQAAGLRCVVTPHGALSETVFRGHFVAGALQPNEDWLSRFAEALIGALAHPEHVDEREVQSVEACRRFDWDVAADKWDALIRELTNGKQVAA